MHSRLGRRTDRWHSIHPNANLSTSLENETPWYWITPFVTMYWSLDWWKRHLPWRKTPSAPHCSTTSKKAECTRAFLQRNLASTPQPSKKQCYSTLRRPILELSQPNTHSFPMPHISGVTFPIMPLESIKSLDPFKTRLAGLAIRTWAPKIM